MICGVRFRMTEILIGCMILLYPSRAAKANKTVAFAAAAQKTAPGRAVHVCLRAAAHGSGQICDMEIMRHVDALIMLDAVPLPTPNPARMGAAWWREEVDLAETPKGDPSAKRRIADRRFFPFRKTSPQCLHELPNVGISQLPLPHTKGDARWVSPFAWWEEVDSNYRSRRRQIYSLIHLAALESSRVL